MPSGADRTDQQEGCMSGKACRPIEARGSDTSTATASPRNIPFVVEGPIESTYESCCLSFMDAAQGDEWDDLAWTDVPSAEGDRSSGSEPDDSLALRQGTRAPRQCPSSPSSSSAPSSAPSSPSPCHVSRGTHDTTVTSCRTTIPSGSTNMAVSTSATTNMAMSSAASVPFQSIASSALVRSAALTSTSSTSSSTTPVSVTGVVGVTNVARVTGHVAGSVNAGVGVGIADWISRVAHLATPDNKLPLVLHNLPIFVYRHELELEICDRLGFVRLSQEEAPLDCLLRYGCDVAMPQTSSGTLKGFLILSLCSAELVNQVVTEFSGTRWLFTPAPQRKRTLCQQLLNQAQADTSMRLSAFLIQLLSTTLTDEEEVEEVEGAVVSETTRSIYNPPTATGDAQSMAFVLPAHSSRKRPVCRITLPTQASALAEGISLSPHLISLAATVKEEMQVQHAQAQRQALQQLAEEGAVWHLKASQLQASQRAMKPSRGVMLELAELQRLRPACAVRHVDMSHAVSRSLHVPCDVDPLYWHEETLDPWTRFAHEGTSPREAYRESDLLEAQLGEERRERQLRERRVREEMEDMARRNREENVPSGRHHWMAMRGYHMALAQHVSDPIRAPMGMGGQFFAPHAAPFVPLTSMSRPQSTYPTPCTKRVAVEGEKMSRSQRRAYGMGLHSQGQSGQNGQNANEKEMHSRSGDSVTSATSARKISAPWAGIEGHEHPLKHSHATVGQFEDPIRRSGGLGADLRRPFGTQVLQEEVSDPWFDCS